MVRVFGKRRRAQIFLQISIGLIFYSDTALFLNHFSFGFEILVGDIEAAHAVGFEPQNTLEIIARESFVEIRAVVGGFGVVEAAYGFDDAGMFLARNTGGAR